MSNEIDQALKSTGKGQIVGPIKTNVGMHILVLRDTRIVNGGPTEASARVMQIMLPITPGRDRVQAKTAANALRDKLTTCGETEKMLSADPDWKVLDMGQKKFDARLAGRQRALARP